MLEEKELFARIAVGDEEAFEKIFHRYVPQIEPVIFKMVDSEAVVKDLIQDIFLSIWVSREKLSAIESPPNWIFKIVYNRTYSWLEHRSVKEKAQGKLLEQQLEAPSKNQTEEQVQFTETARLVNRAVSALPPQTKKIYLLSRESGMKPAEIAEALGLSVQTVKNTLTNGVHSIKEFLAREGVVLPLVLLIYWRF
jgi:RNA polymerase sigma-70 factor (family 1)